MSSSSEINAKASDGLKVVSPDEFLRRLGPGGRRTFVTTAQDSIAAYEEYASRYPAETAHDNIQLRGNAKAEGASNTKSSQDMDNVGEIERMEERVEASEASYQALREKSEDMMAKKKQRIEAVEASVRALKEKVAKLQDMQAKKE